MVMRYTLATGALHTISDQVGRPWRKVGTVVPFTTHTVEWTPALPALNFQRAKRQKIPGDLNPGYRESWALTSDGIYYLSEDHSRPSTKFLPFNGSGVPTITPFRGILSPWVPPA
jgi:hypothetical protein